jgi:hypothetical protein
VKSPELVWDGELDSGSREKELATGLESGRFPEGVSIAVRRSHAFVEVSTRSMWAVATWIVSAVMIGFGLTTSNWYLVVLAPFMVGAAIMQTLGRICILIQDEQVSVFEGVGGIGRRREMLLRTIERVEYAVKHGRGGSTAWIVLHDADRALKFGRHLNDEQIRFVIALLMDATRSLTA